MIRTVNCDETNQPGIMKLWSFHDRNEDICKLFFKQAIAACKLPAYGIQTLKESMNKQNYDLGLDIYI